MNTVKIIYCEDYHAHLCHSPDRVPCDEKPRISSFTEETYGCAPWLRDGAIGLVRNKRRPAWLNGQMTWAEKGCVGHSYKPEVRFSLNGCNNQRACIDVPYRDKMASRVSRWL